MSPLIDDIGAIVKAKMPEGWIPYKWECVTGGYLVTGSVPDGQYTRGPRKGRPRFIGKSDVVVVGDGDLREAKASYQSSTGNCWDCKGTGQVWASWSKTEGTKYQQCSRCSGSGKAQ